MDRHKSSKAVTPDRDGDQIKVGEEAIQGVIARRLKRSGSSTAWDDWLDSDDHEDTDDDDHD
ncbi:MAG: hypothetical protein M9921_10090 [Fimbriimonadaceae bacterium]|nr:hypothetical protein [Fimbriimonadaceae bacterium]